MSRWNYYGAMTRLRELAGISTPGAAPHCHQPVRPLSSPEAICRAILAANVGVTPMDDGRVIRIPIPELSEERRRDLVKVGKRMAEEARVAIRNVRREANELVKTLQKASTITEDEKKIGEEEVQKLTDQYIKKVDECSGVWSAEAKEKCL
jgi:ribosome recycling factor